MSKFIKAQGEKRELSGTNLLFRNVLSTFAALYLIFAVLFYPNPILHRSITFGLFYCVIFLSYNSPGVEGKTKIPIYDWILAALSLSVCIYIGLNLQRIVNRLVFVDDVAILDIGFGILTLILLIEGTRRVTGPWLSGLGLLALTYIFMGHHISGKFGHMKFSIDYIMDGLFLSDYGIWGSTLGIAAGKVMIFLLFGALLKNSGAGDFLFEFVSRIAGKSKGGVAKVAILASAMFGMVSGGALTNATTTGAMTIPAMKKSGFKSDYAACVESCASVGGIFMPPIMGSVALIMSEVVGIPYAEVIKRALLPAIIYFASLFFSVDIRSRKLNINGAEPEKSISFLKLLLQGYNFFVPLGYLIFRLLSGRTAAKAGLETILLMIIIGFLNNRKRLTFNAIVDSLKTAVNRGVMIVATMAMCGVLIGVIDITGVASKMSSYLMYVADISVALTLIVIMLVTLFLGLAMNISSSYLIAAVLSAPILISIGFEPLSVHMFILFYAAMATITPPVALTSYATATIAGASPIRVGFMSMKVGMVAYILPFVFIFNPAILQYGSLPMIITAFITALAGTWVMAMGIEGWYFNMKAGLVIRLMLVSSGVMIVIGQMNFVIVGVGILLISIVVNIVNKKLAEDRKEAKNEVD